ncbi:hypothetical protein AVEN_169104-1, partial [Araneus ventricosus]
QHEGYFGMDLVIWNHDQTTKETPISPNVHAAPAGEHQAPMNLPCTRPVYMVVLGWNRVSSLEPSGPEAETLPLSHCGIPQG